MRWDVAIRIAVALFDQGPPQHRAVTRVSWVFYWVGEPQLIREQGVTKRWMQWGSCYTILMQPGSIALLVFAVLLLWLHDIPCLHVNADDTHEPCFKPFGMCIWYSMIYKTAFDLHFEIWMMLSLFPFQIAPLVAVRLSNFCFLSLISFFSNVPQHICF